MKTAQMQLGKSSPSRRSEADIYKNKEENSDSHNYIMSPPFFTLNPALSTLNISSFNPQSKSEFDQAEH